MCSCVVVLPIRHGDICNGNAFPWTHPRYGFLEIYAYQALHNHNLKKRAWGQGYRSMYVISSAERKSIIIHTCIATS